MVAGMRALLTTAFCAVSLVMISAQSPAPMRSDTMHLTVNTSISDAQVSAGGKVTVTFDITPKRGMHVYAPGKHDYFCAIHPNMKGTLFVVPARSKGK